MFRFSGWKPTQADLAALLKAAPKLSQAPLPDTIRLMPEKGRLPSSIRYALGPEGLKQFAPGIPAALAGFDFRTRPNLRAIGSPTGRSNSPSSHIRLHRSPSSSLAHSRSCLAWLPGAADLWSLWHLRRATQSRRKSSFPQSNTRLPSLGMNAFQTHAITSERWFITLAFWRGSLWRCSLREDWCTLSFVNWQDEAGTTKR